MDTQPTPNARRTPAHAIDLRRELIPLPMRVASLQKTRLDQARTRTGIAVQEHVRRAIDLYLDVIEQEAKARGQFDVVVPPAVPKPKPQRTNRNQAVRRK